jgi:uncharacterized Fe-S cluster protein YjdI
MYFMEAGDRDYSNEEIIVYWRPGKCVHATTCYRELIEVFNPRKRPWVNMQGAPTERIIEIVKKCPTDALTYRWIDDEKNKAEAANNIKISQALVQKSETNIKPVTVQVMRDGPLVVQGSFLVFDSDGTLKKTMAMTSFCRCGASNNIPFCDGYHRKIGFKTEND